MNIDSIIQPIEKLFLEFSWRRAGSFATAIILAVICLYYFDSATGYTYYQRISKKIDVLEKLDKLSNSKQDSVRLAKAVSQMIRQVSIDSYSHMGAIVPDGFWFIARRIFFTDFVILFVVLSLTKDVKKGKSGSRNGLLGGIFFFILNGLIAVIIPWPFDEWINLGIVLIQPFVLLWPFILLTRKKPS